VAKKEKDMEETELLLPREKLLRYGVTLLKDDELLALFLRTGRPGKRFYAGKRADSTLVHCTVC
jgi:DNA repair protein RadC